MEKDEFFKIKDYMVDDAAAIIHNQKVLADIHAELEKRLLDPFEQDLIYFDKFGERPAEPKKITHNGVVISISVLHQEGIGLSDIRGADLLYEIEREKFLIIQYKRPADTSVKTDLYQLRTLLDNCPKSCSVHKYRPISFDWLPLKLNGWCGSWYCIAADGNRRYVQACEAETIFANKKSARLENFQSGLTKMTLLELFSSCRIGAMIRTPVDTAVKESFVAGLVQREHLIYEVKQLGKWGEDLPQARQRR